MNFDFYPSNVNYGEPNTEPSNPPGAPALNIPQLPTANQPMNNQKKSDKTYLQKYSNFFNLKTGTILTASIGMAIGFAFKDFISSTVTNVLQPLIITILTLTHLNNLYDFSSLISPEKNVLNVSTFISSLLTFVFTVITVYYINILISTSL
jgi:large-conductance mechanosensitive channel